MKLALRRLANDFTVWTFLVAVIVISPSLVLGELPYYGDDLHFFLAIDKWGTLGAIQRWSQDYGLVYRPLGVSFEYLLYKHLGDYRFTFYLVSLLLYATLIYIVQKFTWALSGRRDFTIFCVIVFALFPFNPTAYLQLSSIYMVLSAVIAACVVFGSVNSRSRSLIRVTALTVTWMCALLVYEQIVGLVLILALLISIKCYQAGEGWITCRKHLYTLSISVVTIIFVVLYVASPGNPKILSLEKYNASATMTEKVDEPHRDKILDLPTDTAGRWDHGEVPESLFSGFGRLTSVLQRIRKVHDYFYGNFDYVLMNLWNSGPKALAIIIPILFSFGLSFFIRYRIPTQLHSMIYILIGAVWAGSTLAPFLLYERLHIPVYTFLIPSFGFAFCLYGTLMLLFHFRGRLQLFLLKAVLPGVILLFSLLQIGYQFGLREELEYWDAVASRIERGKGSWDTGQPLIVTDAPVKQNGHIFWLETAVGHRYLKEKLGGAVWIGTIQRSKSGEELLILPSIDAHK